MNPVFFRAILKNIKKFSLLAIMILSVSFAFSENFRVRKIIPISLSEINEKVTVESGINDALFVTLPADLTYVSGLELNLKVPEEIVTWRDSVAYMLYEKLSPAPNEKKLNYSGERLHVETIPGNFSLTIYIPISDDFAIKDSPYSVKLPSVKSAVSDGIFLRFMMVMKGVPEALENSILEISTKPVLKNEGMLNLSVNLPSQSSDDTKYSVFIDDKPAQNFNRKFLSTGEHHLSVVSDSFRNELRTFRIEQAKTTSLSVQLRGIEPLLKILCPKDAQVFVDGSAVPQNQQEGYQVSQGEHTVKLVFSDYEIVKTVSAQKGRTYSVNLNVDATITEED